ncbi:hypothetical protein [Rhizobium sp.]|jgi:hypothetical protein|uniref:hypothetical protein n=1 Tax=Rhizobium sp. TaxID=391 RepID=UPI000DBA36CB
MNKIVRDHYPVANLPEDLREGFADDATVRVVLEVEDKASSDHDVYPGLRDFQTEPKKPLTGAELIKLIEDYQALGHPPVSQEEAVARIRELRDEWDY